NSSACRSRRPTARPSPPKPTRPPPDPAGAAPSIHLRGGSSPFHFSLRVRATRACARRNLMSAQTKTQAPPCSAQDAAALVTAEIARFLERGIMPWRAPWDAARAHALTPGLPLRANGDAYKGANVLLLWTAQIARGYGKR